MALTWEVSKGNIQNIVLEEVERSRGGDGEAVLGVRYDLGELLIGGPREGGEDGSRRQVRKERSTCDKRSEKRREVVVAALGKSATVR